MHTFDYIDWTTWPCGTSSCAERSSDHRLCLVVVGGDHPV